MMSAMPLCAPNIPESAFLKKPFSPAECRTFLDEKLVS